MFQVQISFSVSLCFTLTIPSRRRNTQGFIFEGILYQNLNRKIQNEIIFYDENLQANNNMGLCHKF
jgi:hypothetical protein